MAVVVKFKLTGMSASNYDEIIRQLGATGQGAPDGRLYHICYGDEDDLQVIDVFESPDKLAAFGASLMPLLDRLGVSAVPEPIEIYNLIEG